MIRIFLILFAITQIVSLSIDIHIANKRSERAKEWDAMMRKHTYEPIRDTGKYALFFVPKSDGDMALARECWINRR